MDEGKYLATVHIPESDGNKGGDRTKIFAADAKIVAVFDWAVFISKMPMEKIACHVWLQPITD
jgi:hypothetical protein